jgi:hypothetical protein
MKKNVLSSIFGFSVILMSLLLLASCRPGEEAAAAALSEAAGSISVSGSTPVDYEQAANNQAARWQAMAQFYADHDMLNERFDYEQAADNLAARWQAMGQFYEKHGLLNMPSE